MEKILLVGIGDIGSHILEFAARDDNDYEWIIGDVNKEKAKYVSNITFLITIYVSIYFIFQNIDFTFLC